MNDFTKEELEKIKICVDYRCAGDIAIAMCLSDLQDKLQSMIDNYCEHEDICRNCDGTTECKKCGIIWGRRW